MNITIKLCCSNLVNGTIALCAAIVFLNVPVLYAQPRSIAPESITNLSTAAGFRWTAAPVYSGFKGRIPDAGFIDVIVPQNLSIQTITSSQTFTSTKEAEYRMSFNVPEIPTLGFTLRLGEISDRDVVFLNGQKIGETGIWNSPRAQAYDKVRLYAIPNDIIREGTNFLTVRVQGIIIGELGIYRDKVEIGPTGPIVRGFYLKNIIDSLTLVIYLAVGAYFILLFIKRRNDRTNLYFALFALCLVLYSFQRTQFKYELGIEFYYLKKFQTITLIALPPLFYYFIRSYYSLPAGRGFALFDWFFKIFNGVPLALAAAIAITSSADFWNTLINIAIQPSWIPYILGSIFILAYAMKVKNKDAYMMAAAFGFLLMSVVLDILTGRAILNLPTLTTYTFAPFVVAMALILVNSFVRLQSETEALNAELSRFNLASKRFVPFEFLRELEKESIVEVNLGDQVQKEMTVLFSDIRSFTTLSESMTPKENFDFINSYLKRVGPVIRKNRGFIDKYIGDAIMALFSQSPEDALQASIQMQEVIRGYNQRRIQFGYAPIVVGIGLHKGRLMLGTVGESERMEGTVISDAVNLASRIEGLTKTYGASILASEETVSSIDEPDRYMHRFIDRVKVKGKTGDVALYEFLGGDEPEMAALKMKSSSIYLTAYNEYAKARFKEAEALFTDIYRSNRQDKASVLFIKRCRAYLVNGVPDNWDGIEALTSK